MKNILISAAMLCVLVLGIGTSHAVLSVNDAVPGQDVIVPVICEGTLDVSNNPTFGGLNTLIAIADKEQNNGGYLAPPNNSYVATAIRSLYDYKSGLLLDVMLGWTPNDVVADNCQTMIMSMSPANRPKMQVQVQKQDGSTMYLFAGYVVYKLDQYTTGGGSIPTNRFLPSVYLVDLAKGFASGFNGISSEGEVGLGGAGPQLGEANDASPVSAASLFPRMFLLNDNADTMNWWIFLAGRNKLGIVDPALYNTSRSLQGSICNEEEVCYSIQIPIPYALNIVNVLDWVPGGILFGAGFPSQPVGGYGSFMVSEAGTMSAAAIDIKGTSNWDSITSSILPIVGSADLYSIYGWSYQREASNSGPALSWDVVHEIPRTYCISSGSYTLTTPLPSTGYGNSEACSGYVP